MKLVGHLLGSVCEGDGPRIGGSCGDSVKEAALWNIGLRCQQRRRDWLPHPLSRCLPLHLERTTVICEDPLVAVSSPRGY